MPMERQVLDAIRKVAEASGDWRNPVPIASIGPAMEPPRDAMDPETWDQTNDLVVRELLEPGSMRDTVALPH